jgi:allantoinase
MILRNLTVVTPEAVSLADIETEGGRIAAIAPDLPAGGPEIDARGLTALPAVIDAHVHFNEPGRTDWEGAAAGSRALAAGGGCLFFDMPLNSAPCTIGPAQFDAKRAALARSSLCDFALWGGIVPGNLEALPELAARGVIGFKAFMADSGLPEFPRADDLTLYEGMRAAARLGLPVAVHAENNEIVSALTRRALDEGRHSIRDFLDSRPILAEVEAIHRAALLALETGCRLHIVHISSGRGIAAALEARARGVDISIETCSHYLHFTEDDVQRIGAAAKCAPPLRPAAHRDALLAALTRGEIDIVASDHSPAPLHMKQDANFFRIWGGIAGVQSTLAVLLERQVPLSRIASVLAENPASRFSIGHKGRLAAGYDADLVLVDLAQRYTLRAEDLRQRHPLTPYLNAEFRGRIVRTILRGQTICENGKIASAPCGQLVTPHAQSRTNA